MSQQPDLNKLYNLQPGQRALIEVELLNTPDGTGVVAAICGVSRIQKRSREEYFRIHSIEQVKIKKKRAPKIPAVAELSTIKEPVI